LPLNPLYLYNFLSEIPKQRYIFLKYICFEKSVLKAELDGFFALMTGSDELLKIRQAGTTKRMKAHDLA